jgi:hypothetical protein
MKALKYITIHTFTSCIRMKVNVHYYSVYLGNINQDVRFQVLTAASLTTRAFRDIAPCSLGVHGRFGDAYCLHHHGDDHHL